MQRLSFPYCHVLYFLFCPDLCMCLFARRSSGRSEAEGDAGRATTTGGRLSLLSCLLFSSVVLSRVPSSCTSRSLRFATISATLWVLTLTQLISGLRVVTTRGSADTHACLTPAHRGVPRQYSTVQTITLCSYSKNSRLFQSFSPRSPAIAPSHNTAYIKPSRRYFRMTLVVRIVRPVHFKTNIHILLHSAMISMLLCVRFIIIFFLSVFSFLWGLRWCY